MMTVMRVKSHCQQYFIWTKSVWNGLLLVLEMVLSDDDDDDYDNDENDNNDDDNDQISLERTIVLVFEIVLSGGELLCG